MPRSLKKGPFGSRPHSFAPLTPFGRGLLDPAFGRGSGDADRRSRIGIAHVGVPPTPPAAAPVSGGSDHKTLEF